MNRLLQLVRSKLGRSAGIFFIANAMGAAIPFLLLPVLTRYLTPTDYGILAMFQVLVGVTIPFIGVNAHGAITRQYYRREELDFARYVGNTFYILAVTTLLLGVTYLIAGPWVQQWTDYPASWLWAIVALAAANYAVSVIASIWQVESKPVPYGAFFVGLTAAELGFALWLIVGQGWEWDGRVVSRTAVTAVFAGIALVVLLRKGFLNLRFEASYIRHALSFGVPLIPHTLGMWAITMTDRIFITNMVGVSETGLYAVGAQIAMALNLLITGFASAWTPWFYERLQRNDPAEKRQVVKVTYAVGGLFVLAGLVLGIGAPPLLGVFLGPNFERAGQFILFLALGNAAYGGYRIVVGYLFYEERTRTIAAITAMTALANVVGNYVLIGMNGSIGAAQATFFAYVVSLALIWVAAARAHPMPWKLWKS